MRTSREYLLVLKAAPTIAIAVLTGPIVFGLAATFLPAFGYFPALGGEQLSLEPWRDLLDRPGLLRSCAVSLASGIITTLVALAIVTGFVAGWSHTRLFKVMQHAISPLLSVPHAAAAFGLAFLLMPSGWIMRVISPWLTGLDRPPDWLIVHDPYGLTMMAGLVAKEMPFLLLITLAAMPPARPRETTMIASNLGYGRMAAFIHGVWPRIYPQIRLAVFAVIAYSSSVVDVGLILGPTNPAPLAVRLVRWMSDPDLTVRFMASAGAVLQLAITVAALAIWIAFEKIAALAARRAQISGRRYQRDSLARLAFAILTMTSAIAVFLGLAALALWSVSGLWQFPDLVPSQITMKAWIRQADTIGGPLIISVGVGLAAMSAAVVLALACLENEARTGRTIGSKALAAIYFPLIVPQASFVFGLQLFFLAIGMDTNIISLVLVHLAFVFPYVMLSLGDPWRSWDPRFGQAARTMGSSPDRVFWQIRLPMLLRPAMVAGAVGFAVSIGQYLPTVLIGAGRWPTITTEAVALASGGDRRVIGVYAFIQLLLPFIAFSLAALVPALAFANRRDMKAAT